MSLPVPTPRAPGCASDLELDELLAGDLAGQPREGQLRAHLDGCARCRDRLAAFAAVEPPPPDALRSDIARAGARRRPILRLAAAAAVLGAAAAAFVLIARPGSDPAPDGERTKGGLALTLFVKRTGGAIDRLSDEGALRAGDEMRFSIASPRPGYAIVLGLDATPAVTVYVPNAPGATAVRVEAGSGMTLPGSIVADAAPGRERIVAVLCDGEIAPTGVRARALAALAATRGRPELVSSLGSGCFEASVLVRKEPPPR